MGILFWAALVLMISVAQWFSLKIAIQRTREIKSKTVFIDVGKPGSACFILIYLDLTLTDALLKRCKEKMRSTNQSLKT